MALYAIGDIHACFSALQNLLSKINFHPQRDRLWFVGDCINRGPDSLKTLRFLRSLGDRAVVVMGNHEGRLLAALSGYHDPALEALVHSLQSASDASELEQWIRAIPLFHLDRSLGIGLVHAGLSPRWRLADACRYSDLIHRIMSDPEESQVFFQQKDGFSLVREPEIEESLDHLRFVFSVMTKIRMCTVDGEPLWASNPSLSKLANPYAFDPSDHQQSLFHPWHAIRFPEEQSIKLIYGHWAAAGLTTNNNTWGLDSGCVYGGQLTAIRLDQADHPITQVPCQQYVNPAY